MVGGSTQRTVQYSLYSLLYNIIQNYIRYIILQQCQDCYLVPHKVYTLNQVTLQYQLYSTILTYRTVTFVTFLYTHTSHLKYITVHLYICRHYCITLEQYTFLGNSTHYTYFYLFTLHSSYSCSPTVLSSLARGCLPVREGKEERERGREGEGEVFLGRNQDLPPTTVPIHNTFQAYI